MSLAAITASQEGKLNQESPLFAQMKIGTVIKDLVASVLGGVTAPTGQTVRAGVAATATIDLSAEKATSIVSIQAYVAASGAIAAKGLLVVTTDYTYNATTKLLTCVSDQHLNNLVINYR